ncbi:hypothetical protein QTQ03_09940 [Micromonospora sp. WMMA1363]|uniref:hypothetical protein n=1 Tax=Micromonospora sp. WMMA1363 TaxID=3053985 RepID=UPI00259C8A40|nr:hypothetical protein [Micromonospora sp. WMMA1363]MDM4719883.1 hypothetical protein [Micromonospora sp. WMMA1363]
MAGHGMCRRCEPRREHLIVEITNNLRRYATDARQHIGHASAGLHRADHGAAVAVFVPPLGRSTDAVMTDVTDGELRAVHRLTTATSASLRWHREAVGAEPPRRTNG